MKRLFLIMIVACVGISCLDIYFSFHNEMLMLNEGAERNPIMYKLIETFGIAGAMFVRFLSSLVAAISVVLISPHYPKLSWGLMLAWFIEQSILLVVFFSDWTFGETFHNILKFFS